MKKEPLHNKKELMAFRKQLRNNSTSAEAFLWNYLKQKQLQGRKFRRQHSIKNFIVDFYCPTEKLIIELDGAYHFTPTAQEIDRKRDDVLESYGFQVLRFENKMVFDCLDSVLMEISASFKNSHPISVNGNTPFLK